MGGAGNVSSANVTCGISGIGVNVVAGKLSLTYVAYLVSVGILVVAGESLATAVALSVSRIYVNVIAGESFAANVTLSVAVSINVSYAGDER